MLERPAYRSPEAAKAGTGEKRAAPGRMMFGTALLSSASIIKLLLQCILIPVLARLLGPGIFGEMSIAMSFVLLANMLSDGGMGAALIREHDASRDLESTVYWMSALIGVGLAATVAILAWPIAFLYGQMSLFPVLLALAPILVLSSALSVANARIIREQRFEVFAAGDIGCAVLSAVAGLVLAFEGFGVWSLVVQQLVYWTAKAVWITRAARFRPDPVLSLKLARPLFRFSANNLAANVADFAGKNAPILLVGGLLGPASVARFSMSYQLTRVAEMVVSDPVNLATFAGVSAAANRHEAREFVMTAFRILMLLLLPLFVGLALTADLTAPIILGHRWAGTGPALAALAPGALLLCLYRFATAVLLGKGHSGRTFKLTLLTGIATTLGTLAGVHFGVTMAVVGFSVGAAVLVPVYLFSLAHCLAIPFIRMARACATSFVATMAMSSAVILVRAESFALSAPVELGFAVAGGAVAFAAAALLLGGREILSDFRTLRRQAPGDRAAEPQAWPFLPPALDDAPAPLEPAH
ncbi:MAG TPA: lipopolysaccharide biosynthesis protein [Rhizomicrobium sp.]|jgi:PST family polysaccharide transporter